MISVVVPAHNEQKGIALLLPGLLADARSGELDVVVVCNGCTDSTAEAARGFGPDVTVIELAEASKALALRRGDAASRGYPRLYVDADVGLGIRDVRELVAKLDAGVLATAPRREIPRDGVSLPVRWYYDVWERLPQVQDGLFGRGVIAVSEEGHRRTRSLPPMMADDLVVSEAFGPDERLVVDDAAVVIRPPRTLADLVRRRTRVVRGNRQADAEVLRGIRARTRPGTLVALALRSPRLAPRLVVFAGVTLAARLLARHMARSGDTTSWLRDESSRT